MFLDSAKSLYLKAMNSLADESSSPDDLPTLQEAPDELKEYIESLHTRIGDLRGKDITEKITKIEKEINELESRKTLQDNLDIVLSEIERKQRLAAYQICLDETKTNAITRKSTEITTSVVTEQLASSFKNELDALSFKHVEVEMVAAGGSRGALFHKLQLRRAPGVSVPKVVSEGESRCLSIASFFAELSTADDRSAILFDDPVSSLDHHWRENVARRLVKEAKTRQVIVFTHDIVFLLLLTGHAEKNEVDLKSQYLRRAGSDPGMTEERLPWAAMKVKDRIGHLKDLYQEAAAVHRRGDQEEYEQKGAYIYGLLREAWERAVEEVLLNGVIERYRNSVETNKAKVLDDISESDCRELSTGMTQCSRWLPGHDQAAAESNPFPDPTHLNNDINNLDEWVKGIRARRR